MLSFEGFPEFLKDYFFVLNKTKADLTVSDYASDLKIFFKFLKAYKTKNSKKLLDFSQIDVSDIDLKFVEKITIYDAYAFLDHCRSDRRIQELSDASDARRIASIRSLYFYLHTEKGFIAENPMVALKQKARRSSRLPKFLNTEQSVNLLKTSEENKFKERDFCILTLFLNCGLRLSELCSLDISSFDGSRILRVIGKGNKERVVYLNDACVHAINAYLTVRPSENVKDRNALFISQFKQRLNRRTVQHIVYTCLEKNGLGDYGFSPHTLRHTAATLMYNTGKVDLLAIKEILGHASLNTTQIYTHLAGKQIADAMNANPLSDIKPSGNSSENEEKLRI
jgi:site-specific recombinase XerD